MSIYRRLGSLSVLASLLVAGAVAIAPAHADTPSQCTDTSTTDGPIAGCMAASRAAHWMSLNIPYNTGVGTGIANYRADCSGFVAYALHLSDTTPTPGGLVSGQMYESNGFNDVAKGNLQQGDILTNPGAQSAGHVVMFDHWADSSESSYWGWEQSGSGTLYRDITYPYDDPNAGTFYPQHYSNLTSPRPAAPAVSITSPDVTALVGGNVTVTASASDATAGASLSTQFFVDGTAYGSAVAGSSPSITWNSSAVNGAHTLTAVTTATNNGQSSSTTSAAVVVNVRNRFQVAFNASGGSNTLYLYGNGTGAIDGGTPVGVAPGTHPAIAELAGGGFQVAFTADKTNQLYLYGTGPGSVTGSTPVGVAAGTSPAITALPGGGFQTVFTASGGNTLWRYGVGAGSYTGSTPVGVAAGTSPAVTTLSNGSIQVAFTAANTNQLYLYGDGTGAVNGATPAGVAAGTSPAITALPGGGFQTVFTASGGNTLWRYGVGAGSYTGSTPVGVAAGTSPAVTTLSNGSIQVAFTAANTNQLYLYGDGTGAVNGSTPAGVAAGTNPAITALPGGGFQTVFTASGGSNTLWRYGVGAGSYSGSTPDGIAAGTSPAIN